MARKTDPETAEIRRLNRIYKGLLPKQKELAKGLIQQAARLKIRLDQLNLDIAENGMTELFQQSQKVEPYWRERPQAALFVKLDKNYQAIMKQLAELLPAEEQTDDELSEFRNNG